MTSNVTLNRLLSRLKNNVLSPENEDRLRHSQYERNRAGANVEHARALILAVEKESATVRVQSQRQQLQADLQQKRALVQKLNARLRELNDTAASESEDEDDEDKENVLNTYAPARRDVEEGIETGEPQASRVDEAQRQELRARRPLQASDNRAQASTSAREQLFQGRSEARPDPSLSQTETMMSHNRTQQEALTTGLLKIARDLTESSRGFGESLKMDQEAVKRAEGGLDKSAQGMEAAEKRMGMLRRMSEGQGWWGRIKLYGFIFGLWVACFLLVFVGPKLRF